MSTRRIRLSFAVCSIALLVAPAAAANGPLGGATDPVTKVVSQVLPPVAPIVTSPVVTQPIATTAATPVQTATGTASAVGQTAANVATTASVTVKGATSAVADATARVAPSVPVVSGGVAASTPTAAPKAAVNDKTTITPKSTVSAAPATDKKVEAVSAPRAASPVPAPVVRSAGSETVTQASHTRTATVRTVARAHVAVRRVHARARRRGFVLRISPRHGVTRLVAELAQQPRVEVLHTPPVAPPVPAVVLAPAAPPATVSGGRHVPAAAQAKDHGLGFDSPLGRFAVSGAGVLLGGSESGAAKVSLVVPAGLVGLAALVALAALVGQRRAEQRRRVLR
jgi:hypothetical protein